MSRGLGPGDPRHGTRNGYGYHRCRCAECRAANARSIGEMVERRRGRLGSDDPRHGRAATYNNWACRCAACVAAKSESNRAQRQRRKGVAS